MLLCCAIAAGGFRCCPPPQEFLYGKKAIDYKPIGLKSLASMTERRAFSGKSRRGWMRGARCN